jgi:hypothetical protein
MTIQEPHGPQPKPPECDRRDWLVLSLKWSTGDSLVWYRTASSGYTTSLIAAGRYTEAEARRGSLDGVTLAVPLDGVIDRLGGDLVVRNTPEAVARLKELSKAKGAT